MFSVVALGLHDQVAVLRRKFMQVRVVAHLFARHRAAVNIEDQPTGGLRARFGDDHQKGHAIAAERVIAWRDVGDAIVGHGRLEGLHRGYSGGGHWRHRTRRAGFTAPGRGPTTATARARSGCAGRTAARARRGRAGASCRDRATHPAGCRRRGGAPVASLPEPAPACAVGWVIALSPSLHASAEQIKSNKCPRLSTPTPIP